MKRIRRCKTCGCDISNRYIQTQRCLKCSVEHDRRMERLRRRRQAELFAETIARRVTVG